MVSQERWLAILVSVLAIYTGGSFAQAPAATGRTASRALDVPYDPTPHPIVKEMLALAQVGASDVVYDLGCGDGRIVIAAVKLGARGVCIDIDPQRINESRRNAQHAGVAERIVFLNQDLFETDISNATVVMLFLWPRINLKLRPKLWRELKPGTRVVSYIHSMADWQPQEIRNVKSTHGPRELYLWTINGGNQKARE